MDNQEHLIHYGVLGMKWGVSRQKKPNYVKEKKAQYKADKATYKSDRTRANRKQMTSSRNDYIIQKTIGKKNKVNSRYSGTDKVRNYNNDMMIYGKHGVKTINKSLNKGRTYKQAAARGFAKFVLMDAAPSLAIVGVATAARFGGPKLASKINSKVAENAARKGRKLLEKGIDMTKANAFSKHKIRPGQVISIK